MRLQKRLLKELKELQLMLQLSLVLDAPMIPSKISSQSLVEMH